MARGKKKESALTPEEKLAQALVPDWEQPYKVPVNWCWIHLGSIGYTNIGLTYRPGDVSQTGTIVLRSSNIQNGQMDYSDVVCVKMDVPESKMSQKGDILICARNGSKALVGKTAIIDRDGMSYGAFMAIFRSKYNNLIYYYLNSHYFRDIIDHDVGTTTINQVTQSLIKELPFPLPPLAEQKRIVARIEYLFAKLDETKEKAQFVLDSFETRKAAILHKAFTGELTAKWRAEHGVNLDGWQQTTIGKESLLITKGASPRWQGITYTDDKSQTLFVTSENVRDGYLDLTKEKYLDNRINEIQRRSVLQKGDVLVNIVGASIGRAAIFDLECLANTNQAVCLIRLKGSVVNRFLCYYLNSPVALTYYGENKVETARANISLTNISDMGIALPSVVEQHEIVSILDSLFAKEQQAKEAAETVLEKIDLLKKSILARAFRGELGINASTEESSLELLLKSS